MTSILRSLIAPPRQRAAWAQTTSLDELLDVFRMGGYAVAYRETLTSEREEIGADFIDLVQGAYRNNGVVFAAMVARLALFSQVRFQFQQLRGGTPGDLFGTADLRLLEKPEPTKTTSDLLSRAIVDADLAGNWFGIRRPDRIKRARPDWSYLVLGSQDQSRSLAPTDIDAEVVGLVYQPGGPYSGEDPQTYLTTEFAHFAPYPDPQASYRGMSWLTPIVREIMADNAATTHKLKFFENGGTPNMVVKFPPALKEEKAREWINTFEQDHTGVLNAYRTVFLGGGADMTVVGRDLQQLDFKVTQGAGETRIAAASGIHPTIIGLSEGLQGSSLNAGNFGAARRLVADKTLHHLWGNIAGSLESIVPPPSGARLWYDIRQHPFLAEDVKDAADVLALEAQAIRTLTDGGYEPGSVIDAVTAGDLKRLIHTGAYSVQLQPPGAAPDAPPLSLAATPVERPLLASGEIVESTEVRCSGCSKLLAEHATPPYRITCPRCKVVAAAGSTELATVVSSGPEMVRFEQGSIHVEVHPADPPHVVFAEGAIRAPHVVFAEGAVAVTTPEPAG